MLPVLMHFESSPRAHRGWEVLPGDKRWDIGSGDKGWDTGSGDSVNVSRDSSEDGNVMSAGLENGDHEKMGVYCEGDERFDYSYREFCDQ